jgi:hypothetical protein
MRRADWIQDVRFWGVVDMMPATPTVEEEEQC